MRFTPTLLLVLLTLPLPALCADVLIVEDLAYSRDVRPLLAQYCFRCHGEHKPKGETTLSTFVDEATILQQRKLWHRALEQIESEEMPTEEPLPTEQERQLLIHWINHVINDIDWAKMKNPGYVTLPRLTKEEYSNTVRDLLGVDLRPGRTFSEDGQGQSGFNTDRDSLFLSPAQMEKYFAAAERAVDALVALEQDPIHVHLESEAMFMTETRETPKQLSDDFFGYVLNRGQMSLYDSIQFPYTGLYEFRIRARSTAGATGARLQINSVAKGDIAVLTTTPAVYALTCDVPAGTHQVQWNIEKPTLKQQQRLADNRSLLDAVANIERPANKKAVVQPNPPPNQRPGSVAIDWVEVRGPIRPAGSSSQVFVARPGSGLDKNEAAKQVLSRMIPRAFRRPLKPGEVERYLELFRQADSSSEDFYRALKPALVAVLVSPHFLYRPELQPASGEQAYRLDDYQLASRLSYFLWQSMPDDELFRLASQGELHEPEVLRQQAARMLRDPKAYASLETFLGQWLGFAPLGKSVLPDAALFPQATTSLLESMKAETVHSFLALVNENRSLLELLDSDRTWLNEELALHYAIEGVLGNEIRPVKLASRHRGGLLGMGSVLAATSSPSRTSPVVRGAWVLQTLLGVELPEPPADAGALPGDAGQKEGLTLREELEQHRSVEGCASCHQKIDPIGFGLENFDAIGRYRTTENGKPINNLGELPGGVRFAGPVELKQYLVKQRKDEFVRNLAANLLAYGLGRELQLYDEPAVTQITDELRANDYQARMLIEQIIMSYPFQHQQPYSSTE